MGHNIYTVPENTLKSFQLLIQADTKASKALCERNPLLTGGFESLTKGHLCGDVYIP